jgi:hypothetical protein
MPSSRSYEPIAVRAYMSQYGYWIVELSMAPASTLSVMVATIGITQQQAIDLVMSASSLYPSQRGYSL